MEYYLAIDLGASSGRHILGWQEDGVLKLQEIYRFENGLTKINGHLCWDVLRLHKEIMHGMKLCKEQNKIPCSVAIDTWGVDYVLLDSDQKMTGEMVGYRDHRTDGTQQLLEQLVSSKVRYSKTGIMNAAYNTVNQLIALKRDDANQINNAKVLMMTPGYLSYLLTGQYKQEYTIASTTQLLNAKTRDWDRELIDSLGLPQEIFQPVFMPGTFVGDLTEEVKQTVGFSCKVYLAASHDTASAVMAVPSCEKDLLFISSGTWSLMGIESEQCRLEEKVQEFGLSNEGGYQGSYTILKNIMGLWMIQSVRKEIAKQMSFREICEAAKKASIASVVDCNDDRFLSPENMSKAVQDYCRMTKQQVPEGIGELASVIYHSLAVCYQKTKVQIEQLTGKHYEKLYVIGGGSQADYLNQLTADATGCTVIAGPSEATALGNLMSQMIEQGEFKDLQSARVCIQNSFKPVTYVPSDK